MNIEDHLIRKFGNKNMLLLHKQKHCDKMYSRIAYMNGLQFHFANEKALHELFHDISSHLEISGIFFGIVLDGKKLMTKYKIKHPTCFGVNYSENEYLVFENVLRSIAFKHGLISILHYSSSFNCLLNLKNDKETLFKHLITNPDFAAFAFKKVLHYPVKDYSNQLF